ncbi:MAG: roadblock/LC7 domain-containing protein [Dissulfurimicrobium sp.]|uniref:roadblock/LC7 domain-containing protein n=1 Tax=Dissulfurimicrobium TaxID=1769732 RepID=UPI001EDBA3DC|nr:roadblock/LC7 domain-containing protein [Dissulfurimicrobium hydrothermale]UKL14255.1 roadblock/LC7 domain-containing protein [Dissulfurimicrobium hydrothermale]
MTDLIVTTSALEFARNKINDSLIKAGVHTVLLLDQAGNIVASCGGNPDIDITSLAALTAANFAATSQLAKLIGEDDFSLLFHKGKKDSLHFARVNNDLIMVSIFSDNISLGLVRLRVAELIKTLKDLFES